MFACGGDQDHVTSAVTGDRGEVTGKGWSMGGVQGQPVGSRGQPGAHDREAVQTGSR